MAFTEMPSEMDPISPVTDASAVSLMLSAAPIAPMFQGYGDGFWVSLVSPFLRL
jgi:hypothetical protein